MVRGSREKSPRFLEVRNGENMWVHTNRRENGNGPKQPRISQNKNIHSKTDVLNAMLKLYWNKKTNKQKAFKQV